MTYLGAGQFYGKFGGLGPGGLDSWDLLNKRDCYLLRLRGTPTTRATKATNFQLRALYLWKSLQDSEHSFRCFDFKGELLELREELSSEEMPTGGRLWDAGILVLSFEKKTCCLDIYIVMEMIFQFLRYFLCWTNSSNSLGFGRWWLLLFAVVGTVIYNFRDSNWGYCPRRICKFLK